MVRAIAIVHGDSTDDPIGMLIFTQKNPNSPVTIEGTLEGVQPNSVHGFHVHETPLSKEQLNCTAAGAHLNPYNTTHGSISADILERHVGDLGNVWSNSRGVITVEIRDSIIQLYQGVQSIVNRTIVLHSKRDDDGLGGYSDSKTTGNAGDRIACGVIKLLPQTRYV